MWKEKKVSELWSVLQREKIEYIVQIYPDISHNLEDFSALLDS